MAEQRAPNWVDYLGQASKLRQSAGTTPPYAPGTKTMRHQEMKSREKIASKQIASQEKMHSQNMALQREKLALEKWNLENQWKYNWLQFEAIQNLEQEVGFSGGYFNTGGAKQTPVQGITDFSVRDVLGGTTQAERYDLDLRDNMFDY